MLSDNASPWESLNDSNLNEIAQFYRDKSEKFIGRSGHLHVFESCMSIFIICISIGTILAFLGQLLLDSGAAEVNVNAIFNIGLITGIGGAIYRALSLWYFSHMATKAEQEITRRASIL